MALLLPILATSHACHLLGAFQGSEDVSLWRNGVAFVTSGLERKPGVVPPTTQPGMMLALNLTGDQTPRLAPMDLHGVPPDFDFRPHGMHIDNSTQRLYTVAHSPTQRQESVVVWDIVSGNSSSALPALRFRYALVSPNFTYHGPELTWFLNDVVAIDGELELLVTQFGPFDTSCVGPAAACALPADKFLWRCTWDEADTRPDGRLLAHCTRALEEASRGLNGINIHRSSTGRSRLWVNDLWTPQLWLLDRAPDGTLARLGNVSLPGNIDNVERDSESGDLTMGMFCDRPTAEPVLRLPCGPGGLIFAKGNASDDEHAAPVITLEQDTSLSYQVSTSLIYGPWHVLGSPWATGLLICRRAVHV